jgi:AraC-like DNA-binding protein
MVNPSCHTVFPLPNGKVPLRDHQRFLSHIAKYESLIGNTSPQAIYFREHILEDLLLQISLEHTNGYLFHADNPDTLENRIRNCRDRIVNSAIHFIREHLDEKITIERICHLIGTNPSTLNFKFRKELSHPVGEFIIHEKMKLAANYLTSTTFTVSEIAQRCGFENVYYFSNSFRKFYGITPTAYRKENR